MTFKQLNNLTIDELYSLMIQERSLILLAQTFKQQEIDGSVLSDSVTDLDSLFNELGINEIGLKRALKKFVETYQPKEMILRNSMAVNLCTII